MGNYNADLNVSGTITTPSGIFQSLTVSGSPVITTASENPPVPQFVGAMIYTSSGISIANSTQSPVFYDRVAYDFGGLVDLDNFNYGFTIPEEHANAFWVVKTSVRWTTSADSGSRYVQINGLGSAVGYGLHRIAAGNTPNAQQSQTLTSHPFRLAAGSTIGVLVQQDSGGPLEVDDFFNNTWLSIERVGISGTGMVSN